jgi:4-diphosphocytidyl-2-C-methyl-D-erythritol kinase
MAHGIGEILKPLPKWPSLSYVIVMPDISVSTAWVYESLDQSSFRSVNEHKRELELTTDDYYYMINNLEEMKMALCRLLENDLERVTVARFPIIGKIKQSLMDAGAMGALMSGSGPSVFGVFESRAKAVRAKSILDAASLGSVYVVAEMNSWGVVKW